MLFLNLGVCVHMCERMSHELVTEEARRGPGDSEQPSEELHLGPLTVRPVSALNH